MSTELSTLDGAGWESCEGCQGLRTWISKYRVLPNENVSGASPFWIMTAHCFFFKFREYRRLRIVCLPLLLVFSLWLPSTAVADAFVESPPLWERLLWGGKIGPAEPVPIDDKERPYPNERSGDYERSESNEVSDSLDAAEGFDPTVGSTEVVDLEKLAGHASPTFISSPDGSRIRGPLTKIPRQYFRAPFRVMPLKSIPPLYSSPVLPGEGVWQWKGLPQDENGWPVVYMTSYRPSVEYPNAIVHMLLFDMKRLSMKLYIGSGEPGASKASSSIKPENKHRLIAVTNALWKLRHSGKAGSVFRGTVLKDLAPGLATLVVYTDGSVDILEWNETIPISVVQDAKQLRHLIVKDGKVVTRIVRNGRTQDSEIGLGYLLSESQPVYNYNPWGGPWNPQPVHTSGSEWFIASRSAFGIRDDGNLVFAVGHHISTKDLAKALALAGCKRAIHGDANPYNVLGNLYYTDGNGGFLKKEKLSPDQSSDSVQRYVGRSYTSDFYGLFLKGKGKDSS